MRIAVIATLLLFVSMPVYAACPAAPVGNVGDRVIQMVQGGDSSAAIGPTNVVDATEEGAMVYDATNDTIVVCDGTNWVSLEDTLTSLSCSNGEVAIWNNTGSIWECGAPSIPGGSLQGGVNTVVTLGASCTTVGELAKTASGQLVVCEDSDISNQDCSGLNTGALSFTSAGFIRLCTE